MAVVHRTCRVRVTRGQARRCYGLLRAGGDVWAALIDVNAARFRRRRRPIANFQEWCREITGVPVGELARHCTEGIARRYSDAFFETARRKASGERARYPRRKRAFVPVRFRHGSFRLEGRRLRLATAKGSSALWIRLARDLPYPPDEVRSVTLLSDAGRLCVDVTAAVPLEDHELDPNRVAGVDVGIIHPFALAADDQALLVSGRQIRAEERLHLADTKARARKMAPKTPRRGQLGSRRWRRLRATQRKAEARHRRRVHQAQHEAAKTAIGWAISRGVGTLVIGDLSGISRRSVGRAQNRRLHAWRRTHLTRALIDKAERAGIRIVRVDERSTSSTCPECQRPTPKPSGRRFRCPHCGHQGHRDIVGARNIAARGGGPTTTPVVVKHRRAGTPPVRRDRRRHLMDRHRSCPAPDPPASAGSRSPYLARIAQAA